MENSHWNVDDFDMEKHIGIQENVAVRAPISVYVDKNTALHTLDVRLFTLKHTLPSHTVTPRQPSTAQRFHILLP